jgi:hypothetical protein
MALSLLADPLKWAERVRKSRLALQGNVMNDKKLKAAIDRFLKNVNFAAQREIEKLVRKAVASGKLEGDEVITVAVTLSSGTIDLNFTIYNKIELG